VKKTPDTLYCVASVLGGGGIGTIALHQAAGLHRRGLLGSVVCLGRASGAAFPKETLRTVRFPRRRALPFLSDRAYFRLRNRRFDRAARKALGGADAFFAWSAQCPRAVLGAAESGVPVVLHRASTHIDAQTEILLAEYERLGLRPRLPYPRVIRECVQEYEAARMITVPSAQAARTFLDKGFPGEKVVVNPFGVDLARFAPSRGGDRSRFRVLFVGEVGVRKGAARLLEAFCRLSLPGSELQIAGSIKSELRPLLASYRDRNEVRLLGPVADPAPLYADADVFFFPTLEEGSALAVYEAMASGLPVVTTTRAGAVCVDGESGLVLEPGDADGMAAALETLYREPELRKEMGKKARRAVEPYTWEAFGERSARIVESLDAK